MKIDEYRKMFEFENGYWWYRGLHELTLSFVTRKKREQEKKAPNTPLIIFDAGCGTCRMLELLQDFGTVEGLDYSPEAVHLCLERGLTSVSQGDLNNWSPEADRYDVIISSDVISNRGVKDDAAVLKLFYKALKPDGILILNLPAFEVLFRVHDAAIFGKRRYRKKYFLRQLKELGFRIKRASYRLPPLFFFILLKKLLFERNAAAAGTEDSDLKPLPRFLNGLLLWMHRLENRLIAWGVPLPLGSSLFVVCAREKAEGGRWLKD
jgi:SAM-dependent methyltransferase